MSDTITAESEMPTSETAPGGSRQAAGSAGAADPGKASRWLDHFTREEITELLAFDDRRAWASVLVNWGLIFAAMAMVARWPNPLTIVVALFVIGGRQLGMSILMHEAAHRTLFRNRTLNDFVGNWLAAYPVWSDTVPYRPYHLRHHAKNWTKDDPDLDLVTPFPVTRDSLRRKIWRDLSGQTGLKRMRATLRRDLSMGNAGRKTNREGQSAVSALSGVVMTNLVLLGILAAFGRPELYLLWIGAWLTTYSLIMRVRAIAEHTMPGDPADLLKNSRTTLVGPIGRLIFAPNYVNYHLEHHLLMTVPHYKLPVFHRMLRERGLLGDANVMHGYASVLALASSKTPGPAVGATA